ncbi:MAG TPA: flagellar FlbD family protein [Galbitalea sp.]|jgi:flagellar protein FlbD
MIILTKLNNSRFAVNPDLVERIHSNPDTTLTLVDGTTHIVTESMAEVIELIAEYRAKVISIARSMEPREARPMRAASSGTLAHLPEPVSGTAKLAPAPRSPKAR